MLHNTTEVIKKMMKVSNKFKKTSNIHNSSQSLPLQHKRNIFGIISNTILANNMPKEGNFSEKLKAHSSPLTITSHSRKRTASNQAAKAQTSQCDQNFTITTDSHQHA